MDTPENMKGLLQRMCAEMESLRSDRRERIATACLAGLIARDEIHQTDPYGNTAMHAARFADALIAELDKEQTHA